MDPSSTHNIISTELAEKLGIKVGEMGPALEAKGAFKGQEVAVTPLIGKLRVHVQSFVEAEEFYVAPLESHDVILGVPWFHRKHAKLIFPERLITLSHKGKDIVIRTHKKGDTISLVNHIAFEKSMKSSLSSYMIFVRDFKSEKANEPMLDASLKSFLNEHAHCFSETIPVELPPSRGVDDHRIDLIPGTSPPNRPPYRVSLAQQEEIMSQVNELLEKGMVQSSSSPFCSPVLLVQKKDGSYRMCVDYCALNKSTIKNQFPVPRIEDIFDRLQGSSYYSRIDLKSGYHQIRIVPEDIHKTAFRTTFGLYEFLVMPFGLTNALATFNRMMDRIFRPHHSYTGVFFDDIIVYSKTLEEHKEHLKKVFEELHRNKLFINGKKSEFFLQEIRYLGHIISKDGIKMDPEKLKVIEEWPQPKNLHELRSFIDHQSLRYFMMQTKLGEKQTRWANFLSQFHFHIAHVAGKQNPVADTLSRRPRVNAVSIAYHQDLTTMIDDYKSDTDFAQIYEQVEQGILVSPYSIKEGFLMFGPRLCITKALRDKVMQESHEPPYAGHRSAQPTIQAMELYFYWPTMRQDVSDYISKCLTCQKVKYDRHKAFGLLQPLPIPKRPWESITMDFVFGLPKSSQGNNGIWTIVDRFSKQAHFIPIKKTIKATHMANLFMAHIFKYHGFPKSIISDRDPRMTSLFWQGLATNVGTKLNFSSAYHPQTDGQSEIVNSTILDLLKSYVNEVGQQTQWEKYLPLVEYAYNNTVHTSTGKTPFEIVEGIPNVPLILRTKEQIFAADEYVRDVREAFAKVKEALQRAQVKQKEAADKHRRHLDLKEDDWVLLKFPKARLQHTTVKDRQGTPNGHQKFYAKLAKRFYGPFQILQKINPTAFRLKLPDHWHIHNAFHASLLKPYKGTPPAAPIEEDPPEFDEMEEILRPEKILKHEDKVLRTGKILRRYLVKFANYPDEDARWMQEPQLKESLALLQEYKAMYNLQDTQ
ncbi:hypothetical protein L7F22_017596 [Adiantum nelumboides]|nr:hypothetical protein [Adiantum nelumboides]